MLILVALVLVGPFLLIVIFGAPFVRTLKSQRANIVAAFELDPGSTVIDFGAGDGSVVIDMARQGFNAIGYELNPLLWVIGWIRCAPHKNATMKLANYWTKPLPEDTKGIFIFSAGRFMGRLEAKLKKESLVDVQLVSFAFELPGRKPEKTVGGLHLYRM